MKLSRLVVLGLSALTFTAAYSQGPPAESSPMPGTVDRPRQGVPLTRTAQAYLNCLNSDNAGVIESALSHVTYMRIAYPHLDLREIQEKLFDLSLQGRSKSIRSKAFMALQVFANPAGYRDAIQPLHNSGDGLFDKLATRLVQ